MANGAVARLLPGSTPTNDTPIEILIGQITAATAGLLAQAGQEFNSGGCRPSTKLDMADLVAQLYALREATTGEIGDFMEVARVQGVQTLRQHCQPSSDALIVELVDDVIGMLNHVVRTMAN
jgi:hypothetical protein